MAPSAIRRSHRRLTTHDRHTSVRRYVRFRTRPVAGRWTRDGSDAAEASLARRISHASSSSGGRTRTCVEHRQARTEMDSVLRSLYRLQLCRDNEGTSDPAHVRCAAVTATDAASSVAEATVVRTTGRRSLSMVTSSLALIAGKVSTMGLGFVF